jgi:hypothetical protein
MPDEDKGKDLERKGIPAPVVPKPAPKPYPTPPAPAPQLGSGK